MYEQSNPEVTKKKNSDALSVSFFRYVGIVNFFEQLFRKIESNLILSIGKVFFVRKPIELNNKNSFSVQNLNYSSSWTFLICKNKKILYRLYGHSYLYLLSQCF